jgi:hypothetical protein
MSSAILLLIVLIHCELMPRGELISNEQKKQASIHLIFDRLHGWSVQDKVDELSVTLRITGWGLSVMGDVQTIWRVLQYLIITITNSRTLIDTSMPLLLLGLNCNLAEPLHPGNKCATRIPR